MGLNELRHLIRKIDIWVADETIFVRERIVRLIAKLTVGATEIGTEHVDAATYTNGATAVARWEEALDDKRIRIVSVRLT